MKCPALGTRKYSAPHFHVPSKCLKAQSAVKCTSMQRAEPPLLLLPLTHPFAVPCATIPCSTPRGALPIPKLLASNPHGVSYLQVGAIVPGNVGTVTLAEHCDLLLDVLDLILSLLQVNDLDGHHLLGAVVNPFVHLPKGPFADALQLGEQLLRIHPGVLKHKAEMGKFH